jgi:hypothetical protein
MLEDDLDTNFNLALSIQAHEELMHLHNDLMTIEYYDASKDIWNPTWGTSYSSKKFFAWIVLVDRQNTKSMLKGGT